MSPWAWIAAATVCLTFLPLLVTGPGTVAETEPPAPPEDGAA